jgi:hypothetical protein
MGKRLSGLALAVAVMILTGYIAAEATAIITAPKPGDLTPLLLGGLGLGVIAWLLQWDPIVDRVSILQPARRKIAAMQLEGIVLRRQILGREVPPNRSAWGETEWTQAWTDWSTRTFSALNKCARDLAPLFLLEIPRIYEYTGAQPWATQLGRNFDMRLERLAEIQRMLD